MHTCVECVVSTWESYANASVELHYQGRNLFDCIEVNFLFARVLILSELELDQKVRARKEVYKLLISPRAGLVLFCKTSSKVVKTNRQEFVNGALNKN